MNLVEELATMNTGDVYAPLSRFFNAIAMPVPERGQFTRTTDLGALVFLDAPGCVLRLTHNAAHPAIDHRRVLQPLLRKQAGVFRAEIFPGIRCPAGERDVIAAATELRDDGIHFPDFQEIREDNFGELPVTNERPQRFAVALDMGAMHDTRAGNEQAGAPDPQRALFGPLQQAFARAWPQSAALPDCGRLRDAWALCVQMKEHGILAADWHRPGRGYGDFKNAKKGGGAYATAWTFPVT